MSQVRHADTRALEDGGRGEGDGMGSSIPQHTHMPLKPATTLCQSTSALAAVFPPPKSNTLPTFFPFPLTLPLTLLRCTPVPVSACEGFEQLRPRCVQSQE